MGLSLRFVLLRRFLVYGHVWSRMTIQITKSDNQPEQMRVNLMIADGLFDFPLGPAWVRICERTNFINHKDKRHHG